MKLPELPLDGACRCDAVGIRVTAPPVIECVCHCRGCQRMASSAFSLTAIFDASAFSVTRGTPVIGGLRDPQLPHYFCGACMTWMFTRPAALPGLVNVRPTMFVDHAWFAPFLETYASTRLPWVDTGAARSFARFPPEDGVGELLHEYRAWRARRDASPPAPSSLSPHGDASP